MFQSNRIGLLCIFLFLSFFLFFIICGDQGVLDLFELQNEYQKLNLYSTELEQKNVNLHRIIERLKHDPEYVERIARTELGMVQQTEKIFQFSRRKQ
jgi:cell division protein FtsB